MTLLRISAWLMLFSGGLWAGVILMYAVDGGSGLAQVFAWIGAGLVLLVIMTTIAIAEPINSRFRRLQEGQIPEGAEGYRVMWRRFHTARTVVAVAALGCLAAAAVAF